MTFSIVEGNIKNIKEPIKYVEVQIINSVAIINFKHSFGSSDANPNDNYNIFSSAPGESKRRKHFIALLMNRELLTLFNKTIEIGVQQITMLNMK